MGMTVDLNVYDVEELTRYTYEKCGPGSLDVLSKAMEYFGYIAGDKFIVLRNDHFDDYDAAYAFPKAIGLAFGLTWDEYCPPHEYVDSAGNAYEFLDEAGIEYDEEFDW